MGYTTDFSGKFDIDRPLAPEHKSYLEAFAYTRRMKRDPAKTEQRPDPVRLAAGLPVGHDGGYFVGAIGDYGQEYPVGSPWGGTADDLLDYNLEPGGQPSLWCQWVPTEDGTAIEWNGTEKFYSYIEWLEYLIEHFLGPWGYSLNGEVKWKGEDRGDRGTITVRNNAVLIVRGRHAR